MLRTAALVGLTVILSLVLVCAPSRTVRSSEEEALARREEAREHYMIGSGYYKARTYESALENFLRALETDPSYFDPYIGAGSVHRVRRNVVEAKGMFRSAIELEPGNPKGYEALGDLFLELARADPTYLDSALSVYDEGLKHDPSMIELHKGKAEVHLRRGESAKAESVYTQALAIDPENTGLLGLWAEFLYDQKRYEEAVEVLGPLVGQLPEESDLSMDLAASLAELRRYDEAVAALDVVIERDSVNIQAILTKGVVRSRQGKHKSAVEEFDRVLVLEPDNAAAYYYTGEALVALGRLPEAEQAFRKALEHEPHMPGAHAGLGDVDRKRADVKRGKLVSSTSTKDLLAAEGFYKKARSRYVQAGQDEAYRDYANGWIRYVDKSLKIVGDELFIRIGERR
ncbi:MAG: tetratricopeptide repeat protein [candidate division WOR-3 bacterium]|nr:MAG: tetratricopeptide repeat protein [candidate division WOR-3 bacterium]